MFNSIDFYWFFLITFVSFLGFYALARKNLLYRVRFPNSVRKVVTLRTKVATLRTKVTILRTE